MTAEKACPQPPVEVVREKGGGQWWGRWGNTRHILNFDVSCLEDFDQLGLEAFSGDARVCHS